MDPCSLYFYRSVDGHEVDLLVETAAGIYPVEIKLSSTITARHAAGLNWWLRMSGREQDTGLIVSTSGRFGKVGSNVNNCHYALL